MESRDGNVAALQAQSAPEHDLLVPSPPTHPGSKPVKLPADALVGMSAARRQWGARRVGQLSERLRVPVQRAARREKHARQSTACVCGGGGDARYEAALCLTAAAAVLT